MHAAEAARPVVAAALVAATLAAGLVPDNLPARPPNAAGRPPTAADAKTEALSPTGLRPTRADLERMRDTDDRVGLRAHAWRLLEEVTFAGGPPSAGGVVAASEGADLRFLSWDTRGTVTRQAGWDGPAEATPRRSVRSIRPGLSRPGSDAVPSPTAAAPSTDTGSTATAVTTDGTVGLEPVTSVPAAAPGPTSSAVAVGDVPSEGDARRTKARPLTVRRPGTAVTVHFNPAAAGHIVGKLGPARLATLRDTTEGAPAGTFVGVESFPSDAVTVKAVWKIVPAGADNGQAWVLPVFDSGVPRDPERAYPPATWGRHVVIDLSGGRGDGGSVGGGDRERGSVRVLLAGREQVLDVVPVSRFVRIPVTETTAESLNADPGDIALLVGLHVATKETPGWVWATYWWHDRAARSPFGADPPASLAGTALASYCADVEVGGPTPSTGPTAPRRPVFNPWLEAPMRRGVASNCFACHQQAAVSRELHTAPFGRIRPEPLPDTDPFFDARIRTDFVWSLTGDGR